MDEYNWSLDETWHSINYSSLLFMFLYFASNTMFFFILHESSQTKPTTYTPKSVNRRLTNQNFISKTHLREREKTKRLRTILYNWCMGFWCVLVQTINGLRKRWIWTRLKAKREEGPHRRAPILILAWILTSRWINFFWKLSYLNLEDFIP